MTDISILSTPIIVQAASAAASIEEPITPAPDIKVNLNAWDMDQFNAWDETVRSGDNKKIHPLLATVVMSWPYAGDPHDVTAYGKLKPLQWAEVLAAVSTEVQAIFQRASRTVLARHSHGDLG